MMHRRWRYDVMLRIMMLLILFAMMRCLPSCAARHTSLGEAVIIGGDNIICPQANIIQKSRFVQRQIGIFVGAGDVTRTHDLLITNQLHYRLCYTSIYNFATYLLYPILSILSILFYKKEEHFFFLFPSLLILLRMYGRIMAETFE